MRRAAVLSVIALVGSAAAPAAAHHDEDAYEETGGPWWEDEEAVHEDEQLDSPFAEPPVVAPEPDLQAWPQEDDAGQVPERWTPPVPEAPQVPVVRTATVPGKTARMRTDGKAAIPRGAPKRVRTIIAAINRIAGKPYKWGGGHARLIDSGYDCSGAVSYGLIGAGLLRAPQVSGTLARYGASGRGRWVTVYANKGHVYMEVAGLRVDTSPVGDVRARKGVRWRPVIGRRSGFAVRHPTGL